MNLSSTITGLPYVGKTTLFNLLTGGHASTGAFAGAEGETNIGVAKVGTKRRKVIHIQNSGKTTASVSVAVAIRTGSRRISASPPDCR